jgi:hypothetical protein
VLSRPAARAALLAAIPRRGEAVSPCATCAKQHRWAPWLWISILMFAPQRHAAPYSVSMPFLVSDYARRSA